MTLPSEGRAQSQAKPTEFQLSERAKDIATRILHDLHEPCRQLAGEARAAYDAARKSTDAKLNAAIARYDKALADENIREQSAQSSIVTAKETLKKWHGLVDDHLRKFDVEVFAPPLVSTDIKNQSLEFSAEERENTFNRIESLSKEIQASPPLRYIPAHPNARWALGIVLFASLWLYGIGFLWFALVYFERRSWAAEMEVKYRNFISDSISLLANLDEQERSTAISVKEKKSNLKNTEYEAATKIHADEAEQNHRSLRHALDKIEGHLLAVADALHLESKSLWEDAGFAGADWESEAWKAWAPDSSPEFAARVGTFSIADEELSSLFSRINFTFSLPALIPFSEGNCFLIQATGREKQLVADALFSSLVRILANTPPAKAKFTFIDPVGLGQSVADFMHLGDKNKDLISGKVWSEPQHIEQQLGMLTEHMETVIQTFLRNEFPTIREYNRERHEVAQPFRFLVVHDFPVNFSEASARRLISIVKNGPRCGVYTLILQDAEKALPYGFNIKDLEHASTRIAAYEGKFHWQDQVLANFPLRFDARPPQPLIQQIVATTASMAVSAMKVEVPFEKVLASATLKKETWWSASTAEELRVPLGPAGARSTQELALGGSQDAHALLVGRTGSGKTNLMHVIITTIALTYPPQEIQLYLIDFKGGVGFKRYAEYRLPHAKVIAIESEREFGMSVLQGLDSELKRRSDLFRAANVDNLSAYRAKLSTESPSTEPLPRILLIVDEFQEFFLDNDNLATQAKVLFERLARQGRSFGIHFLLATQSLSGSAQLPASIMGQIKVRIALPCSEADSALILSSENKAARALSLPGEGIYNSMAGLIEGNSRFHAAKFADDDLTKYLSAIAQSPHRGPAPRIFEGNALALLPECAELREAAQKPTSPQPASKVELLLGEPIAILPPVAAVLRRQSGRHLMILGREENEGVGMCVSAVASILAQQSQQRAKIHIADFTTADSPWSGYSASIAQKLPQRVSTVSRQRDIPPLLSSLANEVKARSADTTAKGGIYILLQGMHRIKALREDEEDENGHNAVELLKLILRDGPEVGVHVIAWADTWANATRGLNHKAMREFGLRVAAVMESENSIGFIGSIAASKITKPHRALFYDEDRPGELTAFRPYAAPPLPWLLELCQSISEKPSAS